MSGKKKASRAEKNNSELKEKGHEPSRAENPSAQAMARASSARTHHYILGGHHVGTNIHGCLPYLKIAIYVLKSANGGLLCRPLYLRKSNFNVGRKFEFGS